MTVRGFKLPARFWMPDDGTGAGGQQTPEQKIAADKVASDAAAVAAAAAKAKETAPVVDDKTAPALTPEQVQQKAVNDAVAAERALHAAPEKYDLKLPEQDAMFAEEDLALFAAEATAMGLTQPQAQAMLDARNTAVATQAAKYLEELKADPTLGGKNFDTTIALASKGLDYFLGDAADAEAQEIKVWFDRTGLGNNKALMRRFARLGKLIAEDSPAVRTAGGSGGAECDHAKRLYPNNA